MSDPYGVVYRLTSPTGKVYIGQTTNYAKRMATYSYAGCKGQGYLYQAIVKHGWEDFTQAILAPAYSKVELDQLEVQFIKDYDSTNREKGYNLSRGGYGGGHGYTVSAETRAKSSASHKGKKHKPHSEATKAKMRAARLGKKFGPYGVRAPKVKEL